MKTVIQSIHFNADTKLVGFINEKMNHFDQLMQGLETKAEIILKMENVGQIKDKIVEIILHVRGKQIVVKSIHKTFEQAVIEAVKTLKGQFIKYKDKLQRKH